MEENKFYKNAELSKESEEDFKKNVKNSFSTEDFSRQLDLAMYLSKSKFKQVFFNLIVIEIQFYQFFMTFPAVIAEAVLMIDIIEINIEPVFIG